MISKELEQELKRNDLSYILKGNFIVVYLYEVFKFATIYKKNYFFENRNKTEKQAELILKLAKEWQSKC